MRIAIAGFLHESNTFTGEVTEVRHFAEAFYHRGADLIPIWRDAHHELGGFIAGCETEGAAIVPLLAASATPKGPVTDEAYEIIVADLIAAIETARPFDGLLLALHGAMVTPSCASADSETLRRVRNAIGREIPLILSLDMHGNLTEDMVRLPDATIAYRTYPHVDQRERGVECARLMAHMLRGAVRPVQAAVKLPLLIHIVQQYTEAGAMKAIKDEVVRTAGLPGMLSASIAPGYIYADVPHMGAAVVAVADGDAALAQAEAQRLAAFVFERRDALNAGLPDIEKAIRKAAAAPGTVCLMDAGDNIGGGGPGDSTILFDALRREGLGPACVVLFDPEAAAVCEKAGEGARVTLPVGGKTDGRHGAPVLVTAVVHAISDGRFVETEARHGGARDQNQGLTAVLKTGDGHTVILNSLRVMPTSLEQLRSLGVDPLAHRFVLVKGVTAPLAAYGPIAGAVIAVDTPGVTQAGPEAFAYARRPRPLYPLDPVADWRPRLW